MQFSLWPEDQLPRIRALLREVYGPQEDQYRLEPTSQFVGAMLSSRTRDEISRCAFEQLWNAVKSWEVLPQLRPNALLPYMGHVTFAEPKAHNLIQSSQLIKAWHTRFDVAFLADWSMNDAYSWLIKLPGVGPKIAAATLGFSTINMRVLVVDTHVLRTSKRLHLVSQDADFARGFESLMRLVPHDWDGFDLYDLHWLMKRLGQTCCHAHQPDCIVCPLFSLCPTGQARVLA